MNVIQKKFLVLEGNIGAGKSTLLNLLGNQFNLEIVPEPTHKWQKITEEENLLDLFYKDTRRWAYTFQSNAFLTRLQAVFEHLLKPSINEIFLLERSIYCDRFCFAKNCYEAGSMSLLEWNIYKEWFSWLAENYAPRPSGFIYLRTLPEVSYQRLCKRNRYEEVGVTLPYLQLLHEKHEDWLVNKKDVPRYLIDLPVLVLECNVDFEHDLDYQGTVFELTQSFINKLKNNATIGAAVNQQVLF